MKRVLVAGATGYLGRYVVRELKRQGFVVRALARDAAKLDGLTDDIDEIFIGEVTRPETLEGICDGIDGVISSVGITRQKDGLTYDDVDYRGNRNLLERALEAGVSKFVYVSVINAHKAKELKVIRAKERFVDELCDSGMNYAVIRPTGFFSDMMEFLDMARTGRIHIFGDGRNVMNPIHGADLAEVCVAALDGEQPVLNVGGPDVYSYRDIGELAFRALDRPPKLSFMPRVLVTISLFLARTFTSSRTYGPFEFMATVMTMDNVGDTVGRHHLPDAFEAAARSA